MTVQSVNGPEDTLIRGCQVPGTTNGLAAVRCVYLTNGAVLTGLSITNGATQSSGDDFKNRSGGEIWCETVDAVVSSCVMTGNLASLDGGGEFGAAVKNSALMGNSAGSTCGGAAQGALTNCRLTGDADCRPEPCG